MSMGDPKGVGFGIAFSQIASMPVSDPAHCDAVSRAWVFGVVGIAPDGCACDQPRLRRTSAVRRRRRNIAFAQRAQCGAKPQKRIGAGPRCTPRPAPLSMSVAMGETLKSPSGTCNYSCERPDRGERNVVTGKRVLLWFRCLLVARHVAPRYRRNGNLVSSVSRAVAGCLRYTACGAGFAAPDTNDTTRPGCDTHTTQQQARIGTRATQDGASTTTVLRPLC